LNHRGDFGVRTVRHDLGTRMYGGVDAKDLVGKSLPNVRYTGEINDDHFKFIDSREIVWNASALSPKPQNRTTEYLPTLRASPQKLFTTR
jgi:hypothetical protein